eukprot:364708-Chlamydomonas_euryale.AAC.8
MPGIYGLAGTHSSRLRELQGCPSSACAPFSGLQMLRRIHAPRFSRSNRSPLATRVRAALLSVPAVGRPPDAG